ncbi:MAG TPA: N-acetylmuramoyl-L-alanine amidase, partial [Vicinamibacterales bacterium]
MRQRLLPVLALTLLAVSSRPALAADSARTLYTRALDQERTVRDESNQATAADIRRLVRSYEQIVRRYPSSGYSDNALWQAANLSILIADRFGQAADRKTAERLLKLLTHEYPSSSLARQARQTLVDLTRAADAEPVDADPEPVDPTPAHPPAPVVARATNRPTGTSGEPPLLSDIHRTLLTDGVRITLDLGSEVAYRQEEVGQPRRVFFDLKNVRSSPALQDATLHYDDDVVKEIRTGRHPQNTVRVVLNLEGVGSYTVYPLYNPYRLVVDATRASGPKPVAAPVPIVASVPAPVPARSDPPTPKTDVKAPAAVPTSGPSTSSPVLPPPRVREDEDEESPPAPALPARRAAPSTVIAPAAPAANSNGKFSMSRQLGLGVSRIVIDAGHGGHDPGAHGSGVNEAELTLDVALRLQKLLEKQPGVAVVMTRDTDVFIPLQERTAIANREGADLFLSIHANASRNPEARGVETYFLNFANNREAEAVAARENAGSGQTMHNLPDIVKAIALNNKLNESRDLAEAVQKSMVHRLSARSKQLRDLGVKQAPFVVLIGAGMPSVLAEISFLTHKQEGALLKTSAYRQQIAQALFDGILAYQQSL